MSAITYSGHVEHGQIKLKDAVALPEGAQVYVVIPQIEDTAIDPEPDRIAADVRAALADFSAGQVVEVENADDLRRLATSSEPG